MGRLVSPGRFIRLGVFLTFAVAGLILATAAPAEAVSIRLTDTIGGAFVVCNDGDPCDLAAAAGVVTFIGAVGPVWTLNLTTGFSPFGAALLDLFSANTSTGAGVLTVETSQQGFSAPTSYVFSAGGTAGGSITFTSYLDDPDALFGQGSTLGSLGPFGPGAFAGSIAVSGIATPLYSLTIFATITHFGIAGTSFDSDLVPRVAEPSTMLLLGAGLTALSFIRRKRSIDLVRS